MKAKALMGIWGLLLAASLPFSLGGWPIGDMGVAALAQEFQTVTLKIEGMSCGACVKDVKAALLKVTGVKEAEIKMGTKSLFFNDYSDAWATVTFEPGEATVKELIKPVEQAGGPMFAYKARPIQ